MQSLDQIFSDQEDITEKRSQQYFQDTNSFIQFNIGKHKLALPITNVKEVMEMKTIIPYPENYPDHLGVVSLRGAVLPVLNPFREYQTYLFSKHYKLLVIEHPSNDSFTIVVSHPRKIDISHEAETGETINSHEEPVRICSCLELTGEI